MTSKVTCRGIKTLKVLHPRGLIINYNNQTLNERLLCEQALKAFLQEISFFLFLLRSIFRQNMLRRP